jgi:cytidine deaminase
LQVDKLVAEVLYSKDRSTAARLTASIEIFLVFGAGALSLLITNQNTRRDINPCGGCLQVYVIGWLTDQKPQ